MPSCVALQVWMLLMNLFSRWLEDFIILSPFVDEMIVEIYTSILSQELSPSLSVNSFVGLPGNDITQDNSSLQSLRLCGSPGGGTMTPVAGDRAELVAGVWSMVSALSEAH